MTYHSIFIWEAFTVDGNHKYGIVQSVFKYQVIKNLSKKGLFQIKAIHIPAGLSKKSLKSEVLIRFIQELQQIHNSGVTLINSLNIMIGNKQVPIIKYVLVSLKF